MPKKETSIELNQEEEILEQLALESAPIHLHLYQPPRVLNISINNRDVAVFNISGTSSSFSGYNHQIVAESYRPLAQKDLLSDPNISWNLNGVTADWLEAYYPDLITDLKNQVDKEAKPPVGDTYLHIIFPFLGTEHKDMLLQISHRVYRERWGVDQETVWLPESAVDMDTLSVLAKNNIHAVHLREHQTTGQKRDNFMAIKTKYGKIGIISGNNYLSGKIGFDKPWSDSFFDDWYIQSQHLGYAPRISIDGETLGHWWKAENGSFEFTKHLLSHLNDGREGRKLLFKPDTIPEVKLIEKTSWSCMDSGLGRWKGDNGCRCALPQNEYLANKIRFLKRELFEKLTIAGSRIDTSLESILPGWRPLYIEWFLGMRQNMARGLPISAEFLKDKSLEKLFISAYCRDMGWTSCGWFFGDVDGFERQLPKNSLIAISEIMNWPDVRPIQ